MWCAPPSFSLPQLELTAPGASGALAVFGGARAVRTKKFPMVVLALASGATAAYYARWLYAFKSSN